MWLAAAAAFDVSVPRLLYTSQQKVTGELDASIRFHRNSLTFGVVSNGDDLIERFSGVMVRFDSAALGTDRLHAQLLLSRITATSGTWLLATRARLNGDLYRSRWNVAPQLTFAVAAPGDHIGWRQFRRNGG